jgi:hypothetical protein
MNSLTDPIALPDPSTPAPASTPRRKHGPGHVVAIVLCCLMLLPGIGILVGGGAIAFAQAVATDDDGYFNFTLDRVESDGVAVATTDLWFDETDRNDGPWVLDWLDLDLRIRVEGAGPTDDVFVGIARTPDVERYLADAAYENVVELDGHTPRYREIRGTDTVAAPLDQDFWAISRSGSGEQEMEWNARGGRWSIVVMNADGTSDVAADIQVGAKSGAITPIAVTMLVIGSLMVIGSIVLLVIGVRGRRSGIDPTPGSTGSPLPPPQPDAADRPVDDQNPSPVG